MKVKRINEPKLYCEDDIGNFESILSEGDYVLVETTDGSVFEGNIESIHDDSIEIDDSEHENVELQFSVISKIELA